MDSVDPRIDRILVKLARVRERNIETFGAATHRYQLAPPLPDAAVLALETSHRIELPADYRAFLCAAGVAGAGPYYGLLPPERWDNLLVGNGAWPEVAARRCLWSAALARDEATWEAKTAGCDEPFQGALAIAEQGCGGFACSIAIHSRPSGSAPNA
ncbi:MAG: SMI1/KNR4 family protein [Kofleriaceae bacterium]|nr:SMI1/KNR4 family protein [Kofleriaceae bacterium]